MLKLGIIGSPNAGKSTLFNRLVGTYRAIITDIPGTTRDSLRHIAPLEGIGKAEILDSPGLDQDENELPYIQQIIKESDIIVLVIDHKAGLNSKDEEMIRMVRKAHKIDALIVFANKIDTHLDENALAAALSEYVQFGVTNLVAGSAHHGKIGVLMDAIQLYSIQHDLIPEEEINEEDDSQEDTDLEDDDFLMLDSVLPTAAEETLGGNIPIAILGRPNVGKSTLLNKIMKKDLSKVSEIPGTTLDYIFDSITFKGQSYTLYDTAGIRRRGSLRGLERIAYEKTFGMLKYYQPLILLVIDGDEGVTKTDRNLITQILELHLPTLVIINKIDLLDEIQKKRLLTSVAEHFGHQDRMTTLGISAKDGTNIAKIWPIINDLRRRSHQQMTTGQLNKIIQQGFLTKPPTFPHNKAVKVYYTTQVKTYPPIFMSFINKKTHVTKAFTNRLEGIVRQGGNFQGIPLHFLFKDKKMDKEGYEKHIQNRKKAIRAKLRRTPAERIVARKKANAKAEQKRK